MEDRTCSRPKPSFRFAAKSLRATGPHQNHAGEARGSAMSASPLRADMLNIGTDVR
jgi:hypothetical protein